MPFFSMKSPVSNDESLFGFACAGGREGARAGDEVRFTTSESSLLGRDTRPRWIFARERVSYKREVFSSCVKMRREFGRVGQVLGCVLRHFENYYFF